LKNFFLVALAAALTLPSLHAQNAQKSQPVPAYLSEAEAKKPLPATQSPSKFSDPQVARAYKIAQEIPKVIAQQPCYCWCSRGGHRSLHDCYVSEHAAHCGVCMKEGFLASKMTKEGKSPAEIRAAIERGEWANAQ
jgi:hypothetical protein